jgi:hypothetical protein
MVSQKSKDEKFWTIITRKKHLKVRRNPSEEKKMQNDEVKCTYDEAGKVIDEICDLPMVIKKTIYEYVNPYKNILNNVLYPVKINLLDFNVSNEKHDENTYRKYTFVFKTMSYLNTDDYFEFIYKHFIDKENVYKNFVIQTEKKIKIRMYRKLEKIKYLKSFFDTGETNMFAISNNVADLCYSSLFTRKFWRKNKVNQGKYFFVQTPSFFTHQLDYVYGIKNYNFLKNVCREIYLRMNKIKDIYPYTSSYSTVICDVWDIKKIDEDVMNIRKKYGNNILPFI